MTTKARTSTSKKAPTSKSHTSAFAVIETGGKQYLVREGDIITVEKISDDTESIHVSFSKVLLTGNGNEFVHGTPFIDKAVVTGEIIEQGKAKKVVVMKFKAKSNYFVKNGHRQLYNKVKITKIS
jgi:large subunit ribosomal protein L21